MRVQSSGDSGIGRRRRHTTAAASCGAVRRGHGLGARDGGQQGGGGVGVAVAAEQGRHDSSSAVQPVDFGREMAA